MRSINRNYAKPGYVLLSVLVMVVILSLVAYRYSDTMSAEYQVSFRSMQAAKARANAISGIHYTAGVLADPISLSDLLGNYPYDNPSYFAGVPVGTEDGTVNGGRFSIINLADAGGVGQDRYPLRFGVSDEQAKININAMILLDPTGEVLYNALIKLPNMTEDVADAIVDWVDADSTPRPFGAEEDTYLSLGYHCKNGPLNTIEELLLVYGVSPSLLLGNDRNRNGILDVNEEDGEEFSRGWIEYLTCYGREINLDSQGYPKVQLNGDDLAIVSEELTAAIGQDLSDYLVYYRIAGNGTPAGTDNDPPAAPISALRDLVQDAVDNGTPARRKISSLLTVFNTRIPVANPPNAPPGAPQNSVYCPLNDPDALITLLPLLMDRVSTSTNFEMTPRINVSTAPREVIAALPNLTEDEVESIIAAQSSLDYTSLETLTGAWLITQAGLDPTKFRSLERFVSGQSLTYRIHSVGYLVRGGPVARVEAVVDIGQSQPRILYFRDLTELGRGFADLPRN